MNKQDTIAQAREHYATRASRRPKQVWVRDISKITAAGKPVFVSNKVEVEAS